MADMHRMAEQALPSFGDRPTATERLQAMHDFYEWLEFELASVLRRWDASDPEGTDKDEE